LLDFDYELSLYKLSSRTKTVSDEQIEAQANCWLLGNACRER
jgi:hypothetical protein